MSQAIYSCKITKKRWHAANIYEIVMENSSLANSALCGQFLQISCEGGTYLRRPISIHDIDGDSLSIIFEIKGEGTLALSQKQLGDFLDVLGPLGNGFNLDVDGDALIIGGGIGIYPLYMVAKAKNIKCDAVLGYRTERLVVSNDRFEKVCRKTYVTTDDGSFGAQGNVIDVAKELIIRNQYSVIYACGPKPMLKAVKEFALEHNIAAQISLEERMACGFGVCLACGVEAPSDNEFGYTYKHVCKHGPVFDAREVIL